MLTKEQLNQIKYRMVIVEDVNRRELAKRLGVSESSISLVLQSKRSLPIVEEKLIDWLLSPIDNK